MPHDIFISYSRRDLAAVKPIKEEIANLGFSCWMDLEGIESGSREFSQHIIDAIDASKCVLFFLSADSQTSEWALKEIDYARSEKKHVVLVRFNDDQMTKLFRFNFGRTDIIDWRIAEQKAKLIRDLIKWSGRMDKEQQYSSQATLNDTGIPKTSTLFSKEQMNDTLHKRPLDPSNCEVIIRDFPNSRKIAIISAVRRLTGLGLADSKSLVENKGVVKSGISSTEAERVRKELEASGAITVVR